MKEFTPQEIQEAKKYFISQEFAVTSSQIGDLGVRFYTLPQDLEPDLTDFAFRMTGKNPDTGFIEGIYGVSESVPKYLRPWWALHEKVEFEYSSIDEIGRCAGAEATVLQVMPLELRADYITSRLEFFNNLIDYFKARPKLYTQADVDEIKGTLHYLKNEGRYLSKVVSKPDKVAMLFFQSAYAGSRLTARLAEDGRIPNDNTQAIIDSLIPDFVANSAEAILQRSFKVPEMRPEITFYAFETPTQIMFQILDNGTGFTHNLLDQVGKTVIESKKKEQPNNQIMIGGSGSFLYTARIICADKGWDLQIENRKATSGAIITITMPRNG